jgi:hypothetical protein
MTAATTPATVAVVDVAAVDRDLLAAKAVVDADGRSTGTGGRFSVFDVRAGAVRAVAASGVVADRTVLDELIQDVTGRAVATHTVTLLAEAGAPGHVKHMMATSTAASKTLLAAALDRLVSAGVAVPTDAVTEVAGQVLDGGRSLDDGQTAAASAIAGTDRLVTVTGPAGTGKTTMLKVAKELLHRQGRRMVVVAPTKKAASVAGRETGATASSLHGLLHDHGYRWAEDAAGRTVWTRLQVGDADPATGELYEGPKKYVVSTGDRIVVDEAGMVDIDAGLALTQVAEQTGASIAMVGDHLQALPVGHSGAMSLTKRRSTAVVELTAVHRFKDPDWADLSLRLRDPGTEKDATQLAGELLEKAHVALADNDVAARELMVDGWFTAHGRRETIALVTATHAEAQAIGEAIQGRRLETGDLKANRTLAGQAGQTLLEGDIVQTRRNNTTLGVENRALWVVQKITRHGAILVNTDDPTDTRTITADYAAEHVHLGYASTVHGVQGETTDRAIVGPGVDAAGLYVGMTRGRTHNQVIVTAATQKAATETLAETMRRGSIEATLGDSRAAAVTELGRAARTPVPGQPTPPAAWNDRRARPAGHIVDLDAQIRAAEHKKTKLLAQLTELGERIARNQRTLETTTARLAGLDATNHQAAAAHQPTTDPASLIAVTGRVKARLEQDRTRYNELTRTYRTVTAQAGAGELERRRRQSMTEPERRRENAARTTSTAASTAPVNRGLRRGTHNGPSL